MAGPKEQGCKPSGWTLETLKAHVEQRFDHLEELRKMDAEALLIQVAEYQRRLEQLNNEQSRLQEERIHLTPRERFDALVEEYRAWSKAVDTRWEKHFGEKRGAVNVGSVVQWALSLILTALLIWHTIGKI